RSSETLGTSSRIMYVVTKDEMIRKGYRSVADAITTLPGVNVSRYGPRGASANFGIRGSSSAQTLVLIDGFPAPGALVNSVDLESIPTAGVARIEVVEGGGSTLYGSGSIGGIINVITTAPVRTTLADLRSGSFGERGLSVETAHVSVDREIVRNDYSLADGSARTNADSELTAARFNVGRRVAGIAATLSGGIVEHHLGVPGPDSYLSVSSRQNTVGTDALLSLVRTRPQSVSTLEFGAAKLRLAYTCNSPVDFSCPDTFPGNPSPPSAPYAQLLSDARVQASFRNVVATQRQRSIYGIDMARAVARIDDGFGSPLEVHPFAQSALYVQHDWTTAGGSRFFVGVRGERNDAGGGTHDAALSPSVGAVVHVTPKINVHANFATAFRAPTADDLYYPGFSNPRLQDERTRVADITLQDESLLGGATLGWFSTSGSNLIVLDGSFVPQNVSHASIAGVTFTLRTAPFHGIYSSLNLTNLYRAQDLGTDPALDIYAGRRLPGRGPVFASNLELGYRPSVGDTLDGAGIVLRTRGARGSEKAYTSADAFVRVRAGANAFLTLRAYNFFNERYAEIGGYPMPGRSFVVELGSH
ncbi:MAG: TonB-dependent receptor, partial [Candidatus Eremiobacteraeota bacterium]|nr:TonB-dependent receptor [Candidatus Eremiobacteraeota bacterium]